jgi:hypothetical protein
MTNASENSSPSVSDLPPKPNSPLTGTPVSFRNPFEERDPAEVWKELLAEPLQPISRAEAMRRMIEADEKRRVSQQ